TTDLELPNEIILFRDGDTSQIITLTESEITLYDDLLLPSRSYTYNVSSDKHQVTSNEVSVVTMDTTSHDFTWQTFTFGGEGGSSYLLDVAIIDENNIWAVGMIYTADDTFSAVHWDGNGWELKKIANSSYPRSTVYAFNEKDIWFDGTIQWDGYTYSVHNNGFPLDPNGHGWRRNAMWGKSSSDFYVVGNNGNIAHYNGNSWTKIESGTFLDFQDIWGDYNEKTQEWEVLAVASNHLSGYEREIVKIEGDRIKSISNEPLTSTISSTWFISSRKYLIGGSGIYSKAQIDQINWQKENTINKYYTYKIRGNSINDIVAVGGYGDLQLYNGINWRSQYEITKIDGNYRSVSTKGNIVVAAGQHNAEAVITIGRR
ncbi:MAG: glucosyl transferase, partial [Ignavibacteriales bacterium]